MTVTINGKQYDLREWALDLVITAGSYVFGSKVFMTPEMPIVEQPFSFLLAVGCGAIGFKVSRHFKTFK
jgi:hypothetical protein